MVGRVGLAHDRAARRSPPRPSIANTIRLTVFARRREIAIMQLVGATNMYIRMPFIAEGMHRRHPRRAGRHRRAGRGASARSSRRLAQTLAIRALPRQRTAARRRTAGLSARRSAWSRPGSRSDDTCAHDQAPRSRPILVVDDDTLLRTIIGTNLEVGGFDVVAPATARRARACSTRPPRRRRRSTS